MNNLVHVCCVSISSSVTLVSVADRLDECEWKHVFKFLIEIKSLIIPLNLQFFYSLCFLMDSFVAQSLDKFLRGFQMST